MKKTLLKAVGLSKRFCRRPEFSLRYAAADLYRELRGRSPREGLRPGEFWALRDIDLDVEAGEVVGVIGRNGSGKSTLINLLSGLFLPTEGTIELYTDRVVLMDHQGALNLIETGRENIETKLTLHGVLPDQMADKVRAVCEFAELDAFLDAPVATYSLGMRLRLAFSIYTQLKPDLFIVDEALNGGDLQFVNKFRNYLGNYIDQGGSILLCSHDLPIIQTLCRRSILLDQGRLRKSGNTVDVVQAYLEMVGADESPKMSTLRKPVPLDFNGSGNLKGSDGLDHDSSESLNGRPNTIMIQNLTVKSAHGGPAKTLSRVDFRFECIVDQRVKTVNFAIEIGRENLFPMATLLGGSHFGGSFSLQNGLNHVTCQVECFTLAPAEYDVRLAIADARTGAVIATAGYDQAPFRIKVEAEPNAATNIQLYRTNLVCLPVQWQMGKQQTHEEVVH